MNARAMEDAMKSTPEEREKSMAEWGDWAKKCGDSLVDFGAPLGWGTHLDPDGNSHEGSKEVAGYSIVQAADIEAAKALFEGHPHNNWHRGCRIELHEAMAM